MVDFCWGDRYSASMKEAFSIGSIGDRLPSARTRHNPPSLAEAFHRGVALCCIAALLIGSQGALGQTDQPASETAPDTTPAAPKIPDSQLDSLVSPIALYPDPLVSQILVASTYPLELIQLQQWMQRNSSLKGHSLANAVQQQPWDPSIQSMVAFPDVVNRLAGNIQWTTDLGNAFLAQQADVMNAVQRMRQKALDSGNLKTCSQQIVQTQDLDNGQQVIVIQQANPQVVYVPSYDPTVVFGAPAYPYPPFYYPGYIAGSALSFGIGVALGSTWGGSWGYNCGWSHGNVNVNYNNNYNRIAANNGNSFSRNNYNNVTVNNVNNVKGGSVNKANIQRGTINAGNQTGSSNWQHNPQHRGGAPYGDRVTSNKFSGRIPGQQPAVSSNRPGGAQRPGSASAYRPTGGSGMGAGSIANRSGGSSVKRSSSLSANRPSGGNSIGHRNISSVSGGGAFGESERGGTAARASSDRGARSFGGGGGSRPSGGGGGHAGGRR